MTRRLNVVNAGLGIDKEIIVNLEPPPLIDEIMDITNLFNANHTEINGKWYISKSAPYYHWTKWIRRIYHSWLVLTGKAMAFQFAEDRYLRR